MTKINPNMNSRAKYGTTNRDKFEAYRRKARAYVEAQEQMGVVFDPRLKINLYSKAPGRVTEQALQSAKSYFNISSIKANRVIGYKIDRGITGRGSENPFKEPVVVKITKNKISGSELNEAFARLAQKESEGFHAEALLSFQDTLVQFMAKLGDTTRFEPGMKTDAYEISEDWTGKRSDLYKYITFKDNIRVKREDAPVTTAIAKQLYIVNPYLKEETEEQYTQTWREKSYQSNLDKMAGGVEFVKRNFETLRNIMNTSEAWNIAKRGAKDSDQVQENWIELTKTMMEAKQNAEGSDAWYELMSMIDNSDYSSYSLEDIRKKVNDILNNI